MDPCLMVKEILQDKTDYLNNAFSKKTTTPCIIIIIIIIIIRTCTAAKVMEHQARRVATLKNEREPP